MQQLEALIVLKVHLLRQQKESHRTHKEQNGSLRERVLFGLLLQEQRVLVSCVAEGEPSDLRVNLHQLVSEQGLQGFHVEVFCWWVSGAVAAILHGIDFELAKGVDDLLLVVLLMGHVGEGGLDGGPFEEGSHRGQFCCCRLVQGLSLL